VGAATGLLFGALMHMLAPSLVQSPVPFAIVGMLAVFGAAGKLPISVTVMVVEMTGSLQLLPAELIAVTIAYVVSGPATIYRSQRMSRAGAARPSPSAGRDLTSLGARSMREVGLYREPHVGGLDGLPPGVSGELDRPLRDVQPYLLQAPRKSSMASSPTRSAPAFLNMRYIAAAPKSGSDIMPPRNRLNLAHIKLFWPYLPISARSDHPDSIIGRCAARTRADVGHVPSSR
jgi:Chloride channel protein EriC